MPLTAADAIRYRLEIKPVRRALAQPLQTGGGRSIAVRESVLLKVTPLAHTGTAQAGYGEAAPLPWFGTESNEAAVDALLAIGTEIRIAERRDTAASPWHDSLEAALGEAAAKALHAAPCARWALECALRQAGALAPLSATDTAAWQLAKPEGTTDTTNKTAAQYAGAAMQNAPALPLAALLPTGCDALPQHFQDAGVTTFKIKIGVRPFSEETATIRRLLEALNTQQQINSVARRRAANPPEAVANQCRTKAAVAMPALPFKLRLDANGSLSAEALHQWLHLLEPFAPLVDFIEQPFAAGCEQQTTDAFAGSAVRFAFDESLTSLPRLIQTTAAFPQAVLVIKPSLLGSAEGFLRWRRQDVAAGRPRHIVYSSALETGIGMAHALALVVADPLPVKPVGFGTDSLFKADGLGLPPQVTQTAVTISAVQPAGNSPQANTLRTQMEAVWKQA